MSSGTLPTFIVIGAAKAGTTSLWRYLDAHPDVFMSPEKEPEFFIPGARWRRGVDWYRSLFAGAAGATAIGEASTRYTWYPRYKWVPGRIHKLIPDARLIYVIRDPLDRMISMYRFRADQGDEPRSIDEALLDPVYVEPSMYAMQIEQYLAHFDRSQLLVITSDDLSSRRQETLRDVYQFIGVDARDVVPSEAQREFNRAQDHRRRYGGVPRLKDSKLYWLARRVLPPGSRFYRWAYRLTTRASAIPVEHARPSEETRNRAMEVLLPDLERLRSHLGGDFHCWGHLPAQR